MTFKQFATDVFYLPALAVSGISYLMLGATYLDQYGEEQNFRGMFGLAVDAVKFVGNFALDATKFVARGITNVIYNHQKAISVAFWSSLVLAGAAALTVAFWPAALAAVTGFTVGGISIASLVGTGYLAQVAAVAGAAVVATSAAVYASAAVINTFTAIGAFFSGRKSGNSFDLKKPTPDSTVEADGQPRSNPFSELNNKTKRSGTSSESSSENKPPVHTSGVFISVHENTGSVVTPVLDETNNAMGCK